MWLFSEMSWTMIPSSGTPSSVLTIPLGPPVNRSAAGAADTASERSAQIPASRIVFIRIISSSVASHEEFQEAVKTLCGHLLMDVMSGGERLDAHKVARVLLP